MSMSVPAPSANTKSIVPGSASVNSAVAAKAPSPASSAPGSGKASPANSLPRSISPSPPKRHLVPVAAAGRGSTDFLSKAQPHSQKSFKYSDAHFHPFNYVQCGLKLDKYIELMDELEIDCTTLMSIPTSVCSHTQEPEWQPLSGRHHCGPFYYLPDVVKVKEKICTADYALALEAAHLYTNTGVDASLASKYRALTDDKKNRLDPMVTGLYLGDPRCGTNLLTTLNENPGVFTGVGEITVEKEVVNHLLTERWANLETNALPLITLIHTCGQIGMPVVLHCDVALPSQNSDVPPKYLDGLKKLFTDEKVKNTTLVWAHAGGLGRYVNAPDNHVKTLRSMLEAHSNLHVDISWDVVAERLIKDPEASDQWKNLIGDYSDRFLFGSDALAPKEKATWNTTYEKYSSLFDELAPEVKDKVCRANYKRVFVDAREKVREFEKTKLPEIIERLQENFEKGPDMQSSLPSYISGSAPVSTSNSTTGQFQYS